MSIFLRFIILLLLFSPFQVSSQDLLGISTGNYGGITSVMLQPANIVDSRYKFDINLFSFGTNFSNNYLQVNRRAITKFNSNNFSDYQTFKEKYLSETSLDSGAMTWFDVNTRVQLPLSFMATINHKSALAFNIQNRSMVQGRNISQPLARMAYNEFYYPPLNNRIIDASGFTLNSLNWLDVGLTYGRVIFSSNHHFLKGAFTAKYLGGVASVHVGSNDLRIGVNTDSTFNFNTTGFEYARNDKADFNIFERNLKPNASSFGFDAGLVYEYRGNIHKFQSDNSDASHDSRRRDLNKYLFKVGVSLLDAGRFSFDKAATVNNVSGAANNWDLKNAAFNSIRDFDTAFNNRTAVLPNNPRSYRVQLPTAFSVQLDIRLLKGLYLNAMAYRPIRLSGDNDYRFNQYGYYAITPRFESRHFGIYIPYTFTNHQNITSYKQNLLGASIRLGPLFIGSSNLGTMLFNKNLKAADVHAGIKIGITYGKPNKASKILDKLTGKTQDGDNSYRAASTDSANKMATSNITATKKTDTLPRNNTLPLLIDYENGKIYGDPQKGGNIIIINNHIYHFNQQGRDSVIVERRLNTRDTILYRQLKDSTKPAAAAARPMPDSAQRALRDSLNRSKTRLDSTIRRLQLLREELDKQNSNKPDSVPEPKKDQAALPANRNKKGAEGLSETREATMASSQKPDTGLETGSYTANAGIKKKTSDTDSLRNLAESISRLEQKMDAAVTANPARNAGQSNNEITGQERTIQRRQQELWQQQNDLYNREVQRANELEAEIENLRNRLRSNYTGVENYEPQQQPLQQQPYSNQQANESSVRQRLDTVYLKDTVYVKDSFFVAEKQGKETPRPDTIIIKKLLKPDTVFIPAIEKAAGPPSIAYTLLPEELIFFDAGKAIIKPVYSQKLDFIATLLLKDPTLVAFITGHTDKTGPPALNQALSAKRAGAVEKYLLEKAVPAHQINLEALAASQPIAHGNAASAHSQNRRVSIKLQRRQ